MKLSKERKQLLAFLLVVAIALYGVWRSNDTSNQARQIAIQQKVESYDRAVAQCMSSNTARQATRGALTDIIAIATATSRVRSEAEQARLDEVLGQINASLDKNLRTIRCPPELTPEQRHRGVFGSGS